MDCPEASTKSASGCAEPLELVYLLRRKWRSVADVVSINASACKCMLSVHAGLCVKVHACCGIPWDESPHTCCRFRRRPQCKCQMPSCSRLCNTLPVRGGRRAGGREGGRAGRVGEGERGRVREWRVESGEWRVESGRVQIGEWALGSSTVARTLLTSSAWRCFGSCRSPLARST